MDDQPHGRTFSIGFSQVSTEQISQEFVDLGSEPKNRFECSKLEWTNQLSIASIRCWCCSLLIDVIWGSLKCAFFMKVIDFVLLQELAVKEESMNTD